MEQNNNGGLYDNIKLSEAAERLEDLQKSSKLATRNLKVVQAALKDAHLKTKEGHDALQKDYMDDDFKEVQPLYDIVYVNLYEMMTERQRRILFCYVVLQMPIKAIAKAYHISSPGVLKSISLVRKKSIKLNIGGMI